MKIDNHHVVIRENFRPQMPWAVFFDRDGVLNQEVHLLHRPEDLKLMSRAAEAVKKINAKRIPAILVHNAAVVSRGLCTLQQAEQLNNLLLQKLEEQGAWLDAVFYCPHHPAAFDENFKMDCSWHKPESGMLQNASKVFELDLQKSYLIGDTARDMIAAQKVGTFAILVQTGHGGKDALYSATANQTCPDVLDAVNFILKRENLA